MERDAQWDTMQREYRKPTVAGIGRDAFWHHLKSGGLEISRDTVGDFVKAQEERQVTTSIHAKRVNQPISADHILDRVQMDLVDFSQTPGRGNARFLLNIIDVYSRYSWSYTLLKPDVPGTIKRLTEWLATLPSMPRILQSDNGTNFTSKEIIEWCKAQGIKQVWSSPHSPQSNGVVERFNGTFKRMLFREMNASGTQDWVNFMPLTIEKYNNTYHSNLQATPLEVWSGEKVNAWARRSIATDDIPIKVGQRVRILKLTRKDARHVKSYVPSWSDEIYTVGAKVRARAKGGNARYRLLELPSRYFYSNELLPMTALRKRIPRAPALPTHDEPPPDEPEEPVVEIRRSTRERRPPKHRK